MVSPAKVRRRTLGFLLGAILISGCSVSQEESDYVSRKALLLRQNRGIRELIDEAERGTMVPADRFLIGIDEKIVEELLRAQLPLERPVGKRFVARIERANVLLRDKFGTITLEGELHRPATPDRKIMVRILGGLGGVAVDTTTDMLSISIAIDRIDILQAGILDPVLGPGGKKFLSDKGKDLLQDAIPKLQVPVVLARQIHVPALQAETIQLDSLTVPLNLSVERVLAANRKLWVTMNAEVGRVTGAEEGLGVQVKKKKPKPPGPKEKG
ncbi:MAG: hypothetical protein ACRENN_04095 [Candidatus Eiseniibacteriota bacterium]